MRNSHIHALVWPESTRRGRPARAHVIPRRALAAAGGLGGAAAAQLRLDLERTRRLSALAVGVTVGRVEQEAGVAQLAFDLDRVVVVARDELGAAADRVGEQLVQRPLAARAAAATAHAGLHAHGGRAAIARVFGAGPVVLLVGAPDHQDRVARKLDRVAARALDGGEERRHVAVHDAVERLGAKPLAHRLAQEHRELGEARDVDKAHTRGEARHLVRAERGRAAEALEHHRRDEAREQPRGHRTHRRVHVLPLGRAPQPLGQLGKRLAERIERRQR
jgi:hypothetical protein